MTALFYLTASSSICIATFMAIGDGVHNVRVAFFSLTFMLLGQMFINEFLKNSHQILNFGKHLTIKIIIFAVYGMVPLSFSYYLQSGEMNMAVVLAGIAPGLFGLLTYASFDLYLSSTLPEEKSFDLYQRKGLIAYCLILSSLVPVVIYLHIHDHINILFCSLLIVFYIPYMIRLFSEERLSKKEVAFFTQSAIMAYIIIFSLGWFF